jgi:two-component system phosphate regulon sensor histidine kinase PhoR
MEKILSILTSSTKEFEDASRTIRWIVIAIVALTFPYESGQIYNLYAFCGIAVIYNLSRYIKPFMHSRLFSSPAAIITIDSFFICSLIVLVGSVNTPYSAFLFLMIISAGYCYKLTGIVAVTALQMVLIYIITHIFVSDSVTLGMTRDLILTASAMLTIGLLVKWLTHADRQERDNLRHLAEENETERSRIAALIDTLKDAVFVVDHSGDIILHNGAAMQLCNGTPDLKDKRLDKVLPLYVRTDPETKIIKVIEAKDEPQHRRDLRFSAEHEQMIDLEVTVVPVHLPHSRTINYVVICEDITHELTVSDEQTEFISVASHELRTPIAIMEAALSTVLYMKDSLPESAVTIIEQAHSNALLLSGIVKDLAVLREAKNDNIPIQLENIDGAKLTEQIANDFREQIKQKGLSLEVTITPDLPTVLSTERHIREILQNYMTNAIKYSKTGTITLGVTPTKTDGIVFSVKDNGIGISPSVQKNLFNKFFRAEDYQTQQVGGTGLGLYLSKGLAERLGGKVWCESAINRGSTFFLEIPAFSGLRRDGREVIEAKVTNFIEGI